MLCFVDFRGAMREVWRTLTNFKVQAVSQVLYFFYQLPFGELANGSIQKREDSYKRVFSRYIGQIIEISPDKTASQSWFGWVMM
ncbi:hypothetical protein AYW79_04625 [Ferroacidibacillus organovorans]|uniref:Uncharacterized protein n=1 Tax=Ferroacidibacillus organovorans TaxID=1765683 RepID=A0A853KCU9_9BACL|nr:hypothetical protein AYJ22_02990 [Ferroacidibacillus organovorans]OAG94643.1 hypothetical protein AYW79_04625 [Ferroacidibacillus organovorans]